LAAFIASSTFIHTKRRKTVVAKYVINQSTKNGKIITSAGDNQHITINQVVEGSQTPEIPEVPPIPGTGQGDIVRAVGRGAKVFINGKRVQ
jgi:hypothetical protein